MKKLILSVFLIIPMILFAGDPIPGIGITVEQTPSGTTKKGTTNGRGEFVANGLKPGDYIVTIENNGQRCVIGDKVTQKITVPSPSSTETPNTITVDLEKENLTFAKIGNEYNLSPRDAASGLPTGKRQHKPITITKELDKSSPQLASADHNSSRSNKTSSRSSSGSNGDEQGVDCGGSVEISPMKGGQIKIKIKTK